VAGMATGIQVAHSIFRCRVFQPVYNVSEFVFPFFLEVEARLWG
jgi:hypothetical protein